MVDEKNTTNGAGKTEKTQGNGRNGGDGDPFAEIEIVEHQKVWLEPEPLEPPLAEEQPYPLDACPKLIAGAVAEYQSFGQQPVPLIAQSAWGMASLACQAAADVERDPLLYGPISLNMLAVAVSGERKTWADRHYTRATTDWLRDRRRGRLQNDRELCLFYHDITPERLATALYERWPSAGQFSDEAGLVIGSHAVTETAMRYFGLQNRLWDGSPFSRERQTTGGVHLVGRRFTVNLAMQPDVLKGLLALGNGLARGIGWFARCLVVFPRSTIGNRPYTEPEAGTPALDRYNHRIVELLDAQVSRPPVIPDDPAFALDLPRLKLTRQAKECWCEYHDEIERELGDGGRYAEIPDVGAKSAENVARLAAIDHVLADAGVPGEIDDETMERAVRVGRWYLDETRRALCIGEIAEVYADATLLSRWVGRRRNVSTFPPREVMRTGPAPLRHAERRDAALDLLVETNHLRRLDRGGRAIYCVNPRLLNFWRSR